MTREELGPVVEAIRWAWDQGCPVAAQDARSAEAQAAVAIRRWSSVQRRHKKITPEIRVNDLANGLIAAGESDPSLVGPLKVDYLWLAGQIARVLDPPSSG